MGNPRKPTARKKLEGTDRPDRTNPDEPKYEPAVPQAPAWLSALALDEWKYMAAELGAVRVLAKPDKAVLAAFCAVYAEVVLLTDIIDRAQAEGTLFKSGRSVDRLHPALAARREAIARLVSMAGELGATPATRSKVSSLGEPPETDPLEKLLAKKERRQRASKEAPPN